MKYQVKDEGDPRKYFFQIPNMIDEMNLSIFAFRLYSHLKRVAGENGSCYQATETLAEKCKMSTGSISTAKKELSDLGLIKIESKKNPQGGWDYHEITITDIWPQNSNKYATSSLYERASSPGERASSPGELKNNPLRIIEEEKSDANASDAAGLPLTEGLRFFLQSFNATRFKNTIQRDTMSALEKKHGTKKLKEYTLWAARNGFTVSKAVASAENGLENWGKAKVKVDKKDDRNKYTEGRYSEFIEH